MNTQPHSAAQNHFGLYLVISQPKTSFETCAEAAVRAGVRYIQLRMKNAARDQILARACSLRSITERSNTLLIINDDPDIAVESGADGVHLGQTDLDIKAVREKWPTIGHIGLSTHSVDQAIRAAKDFPDLIGVGPVYRTPTKAIPDPVLGCTEMGRMIRSVTVPAVAIGGINTRTLQKVLAAGAINFAVVRAVCQAATPYDAIRCLQDVWLTHIAMESIQTPT